MNKKYTTHEPKKLPVYPVECETKPRKTMKRVPLFFPLLSQDEKEKVMKMTNHERIEYLKTMS
jgi:hypothetical protein